jgi:hypothetical protein
MMETTNGYRFVELLEEFIEVKHTIDRNFHERGWHSHYDETRFSRIKQEIIDIVDNVKGCRDE